MAGFVAPWSPNFTNDINNAITTVENVVESVVPGVIPAVVDSVLPGILPQPQQQPPTPVPAPTPAPAPAPAPGVPNVAGQISASTAGSLSTLEVTIANAVKQIEPQLQADAMAYLQSYVAQVLQGNVNPQIPNVTYDGQSLTKSAAKGHAWRVFLGGMAASAFSAVLTAVGTQAHLDFFSKDGWMATGTIAVATLFQTAIGYLGRLQITPEYEKRMIAAPPSALLQIKK